jgi:hypothetical protein
MKTETYQEYLALFEENMKQAIESAQDEATKEIFEDMDPLTESEWKEAIESGLFDVEIDEEAIKKLYEDIMKMYPEEE